jgi:pimeloyl-ACP methyl ester carboxylesterase
MLYVEDKKMVHGVMSRLLRGGEGDTVVFLHGAGGLPRWLEYFDKVACCNEVLVPEHPGFGKSERPEWIASVADLARYYQAFIANLGKIHLIGSSLGGWLASELAVLAPEAIRSLTLIGPVGMRALSDGSGLGAPSTRAERLQRLYFDPSFVELILAQDPLDIDEIESRNWTTAGLLGGQGFYDSGLEKRLEKISCPTQVFWGEEDCIVPVAQAEVWRNAIVGAKMHVFPRCGHLPHVERSDDVAALTEAFFQQSSSPA